MLHSTGTRGYYLQNNDLLLHLSDLNNDLFFHSTEHLDALLKIITCSKQWKGALIVMIDVFIDSSDVTTDKKLGIERLAAAVAIKETRRSDLARSL